MGFLDTRPLDAAWHLWLHVAPLDDSTLPNKAHKFIFTENNDPHNRAGTWEPCS